jgi:hypothetical protein
MIEARALGLMHMIPEPWRAQAIDAYLDTPVPVTASAEEFKNYSPESRKEMAKKGHALSDGAYPIANESDLKNAIQAYGRCKDGEKAKVRRHIMKRARALGRADAIPASWRTAAASLETDLARRVTEFNTNHDRELSVAKLRTVYLRGVSAHAAVAGTSTLLPHQMGMARVNSFLRLAAGDPSASTLDADLLASK